MKNCRTTTGKRTNKHDKKEGVQKHYHENDQLKSEGNYKDGKLDGLWKFYVVCNPKSLLIHELKDYNPETGLRKIEQTYKDGIEI